MGGAYLYIFYFLFGISNWITMEKISSEIFIVVCGSIFLIVVIIFIFLLINLYQKKQIKNQDEKNKMKIAFQQTLLQSQLEIQEQTLKTISQEIHDNVGQVLTLAKLNLATTTAASEEGNGKINTSRQLIGKAIQDLRDLSKSLNTEYVEEMGLIRSIEYELEMLKKTGTIETQFIITGNTIRLEKQKELILFRIVQESIHNIMKHTEAKILSASIQFQENSLIIRIKDNGKGFSGSPNHDGSKSRLHFFPANYFLQLESLRWMKFLLEGEHLPERCYA